MHKCMPDYPSAFKTLEGAMVVANTCEFFGFDSELTAACCLKLDCDVETLKNIASWFKKNASIVPDTFHANQLKQLNKA